MRRILLVPVLFFALFVIGNISAQERTRVDIEKAAQEGDTDAMVILGEMYAEGKGVARDSRIAADWYLKAAEKENTTAMLKLGPVYIEGRGVGQDAKVGIAWYLKAADKGNTDAMIKLGEMYVKGGPVGSEIEKDIEKVVEWYGKAANNGSKEAINRLAKMVLRTARDAAYERLEEEERIWEDVTEVLIKVIEATRDAVEEAVSKIGEVALESTEKVIEAAAEAGVADKVALAAMQASDNTGKEIVKLGEKMIETIVDALDNARQEIRERRAAEREEEENDEEEEENNDASVPVPQAFATPIADRPVDIHLTELTRRVEVGELAFTIMSPGEGSGTLRITPVLELGMTAAERLNPAIAPTDAEFEIIIRVVEICKDRLRDHLNVLVRRMGVGLLAGANGQRYLSDDIRRFLNEGLKEMDIPIRAEVSRDRVTGVLMREFVFQKDG